MKDKIARAKETIRKRRTQIAFSSGVAVGAGVMIYTVVSRPPLDIMVAASPEALQNLIDKPNGAISWTHISGRAVVTVVNENHSQL